MLERSRQARLEHPGTPSAALECSTECDTRGGQCDNGRCLLPAGEILMQRCISQRYGNRPGGLVIDADGSLTVGVSHQDRIPYDIDEIVVSRLDADANTVWDYEFLGDYQGRIDALEIALTGGQIQLPEGHPNAGQFLCITAGDMGVLPATWDPTDGRMLKFRVTADAIADDCSQAAQATQVSLKGCIYRTDSYLP